MGTITNSLLTVHGMLRPSFGIIMLSMAVRATSAFVLVQMFGLIGAAVAQALGYLVENVALIVVAFRRFGIRPIDFLAMIWRGLLGTAIMAGVLLGTGLGGGTAEPVLTLLYAVPAGAALYGLTVVGIWYAAGLPEGAEADLLALARGMVPRR